jgi:hypothetical protein
MSDGNVLSPICRPMCAERSGPTIVGSSAASFTFSRVAAAGAIVLKLMAHRPRFITALCAGHRAASGKTCSGTGWQRTIGRYADDRLDACQSVSLGIGWKRGEQKQAVGRSRGGRNPKIHALADARGRLIPFFWPAAKRMIVRLRSGLFAGPRRRSVCSEDSLARFMIAECAKKREPIFRPKACGVAER